MLEMKTKIGYMNVNDLKGMLRTASLLHYTDYLSGVVKEMHFGSNVDSRVLEFTQHTQTGMATSIHAFSLLVISAPNTTVDVVHVDA